MLLLSGGLSGFVTSIDIPIVAFVSSACVHGCELYHSIEDVVAD